MFKFWVPLDVSRYYFCLGIYTGPDPPTTILSDSGSDGDENGDDSDGDVDSGSGASGSSSDTL